MCVCVCVCVCVFIYIYICYSKICIQFIFIETSNEEFSTILDHKTMKFENKTIEISFASWFVL